MGSQQHCAEQGLCLLCLPSCWVAILVPLAGKKFARDAVRTVLVMHDLDDNDHITSPRRSEPFRNPSSTGKYYQKARSSMASSMADFDLKPLKRNGSRGLGLLLQQACSNSGLAKS